MVSLSAFLNLAVDKLLKMEGPQPVQPTDYDTCWVARLTDGGGVPAYPEVLDRLLDRQHADGSWGSQIPYVHDRLLTTVAVVLLLARVGYSEQDWARRRAGERFIWQHVDKLHHEAHETIGFEMILPALLSESRELGIDLPYAQLRRYEDERAFKLSLLPTQQLFRTPTSALFSLEAFAGNVALNGAADLLLANGSMATSPSATAFLLSQAPDWRSRYPKSVAYLEDLLERHDNSLPTIAPCDIFMRAWMLNYLHHGNVLAGYPQLAKPHREYLHEHWRPEGLGWASIGPPESDDTAMALSALQRAGYEVDGSLLLTYERDRHFAVLAHERNPSVSVNLHILEAVDTLPKKDRARVRGKISGYLLRARRHGAYWSDKWHASVYYPTSRAVMILSSQAPDEIEPSVRWLISQQHADGAWGQYFPTAEETALALLALLTYHRSVRSLPHEPLHQAARYLVTSDQLLKNNYPELWISKALYAPNFVVRSAVIAALGLYYDTFEGDDRLD